MRRMNLSHHVSRPDDVALQALGPFLLVSFALAWGILAAFILLPGPMAALFGEITGEHPLFYLAVWAPAISAIVVVYAYTGSVGLRKFLSRCLLWRAPPGWYLFLVLGVPLVFVLGAMIKNGTLDVAILIHSTHGWLLAMALMAIKGPMEELGWRGLALPLLQRRIAPLWAALLLGVIWGVWHLPAFLLSGTPQSAWSFMPFFLGTIALNVIAAALFNASRGSILLPALFHFILINPLWPEAQPYDTWLFAFVAAVIVWRDSDRMFGRIDVPTGVASGTKAASN